MPGKFLSGIYSYELFAEFMQSKISSKKALLIVALSGLVLFVILLLIFVLKNSTQSSSALLIENIIALSNQEQYFQEQEKIGVPVRIKIPWIGVNSSVISVGLTSDGAMDVPKGPAETAWFSLGPRPGEIGSAVLAGHYGWKNNLPAVFDNLHKLKAGDEIFIEDENGKIHIFVIRDTRKYKKDAFVPEVFSSNDGQAHLNLITCTGIWNKSGRFFSERLVVFADKE